MQKTKMSKRTAIEWVYNQDDTIDVIDLDDLESAFVALYGRKPDQYEHDIGLWSLCCAATPNCGNRPKKRK